MVKLRCIISFLQQSRETHESSLEENKKNFDLFSHDKNESTYDFFTFYVYSQSISHEGCNVGYTFCRV